MIEFIQKNNSSTVILFIHGFTGGRDTWKNAQHGYFFDQLLKKDFIKNNFDVAVFEYYSKLTNLFAKADSTIGRLVSLFKSVQPKSSKNISITEISSLLHTRIRFDLAAYSNIVVIAHSMGGLVTKACILKDLEQGLQSKISLFLSLAVPHLGADLATYGKLISNNKQIEDLAPLSQLCPSMNDEWVKHSIKPEIKYFYGTYDDVVPKVSATGTENITQDVIACDDNHLSICKPSGESSIAILATTKFLEDFYKGVNNENYEVKKLNDPAQFDDEVFVLKLMLADVHNAIVRQSKEHFLNAEYARKLFSSAADQEKLSNLYTRVRTLYQNCYGKFVSESGENSALLVAEVHQKIVAEDANYLKVALPLLQGLHKIGMLHQLANDLKDDIWWNENRSIEALEALKSELEK